MSLTASSAPFEWIGTIVPHYAQSSLPTIANHHLPTQAGLYLSMPNPLVCIDQIMLLAQRFTAGTVNNAEGNTRFRWFSNYMGTDAAANGPGRLASATLHGRFLVPALEQVKRFAPFAASLRLPPRYATGNSNATFSLANFFGFDHRSTWSSNYSWFSGITATMTRYSQFFHESRSLADISPVGIGATNVIYTLAANPTLAILEGVFTAETSHNAGTAAAPLNIVDSDAHFSPATLHPTSLSGIGEHADANLPLIGEQHALLTAVNASYANVAGWPAHATNRTGTYWNLPLYRISPTVDASNSYMHVTAGKLHHDARDDKQH